jgi:predicted nucleotidyltransferase
MIEKIINRIIETYNPDAIILHGSRARNKERENSDWDIVLLFSEQTELKNGREFFEAQNIEYSVHTLPIEDIFGVFGAKLQNAKVLFEKDDIGSSLLRDADLYYEQGVHWPQEKIDAHKLWIEGRIQGMSDSVDNPLIFHKYFSDFYDRVYNYWYWLKQHKHSQPIYIATEEIAEKDPMYYKLVSELFVADDTLSAKVETCRKILDYLFY